MKAILLIVTLVSIVLAKLEDEGGNPPSPDNTPGGNVVGKPIRRRPRGQQITIGSTAEWAGILQEAMKEQGEEAASQSQQL